MAIWETQYKDPKAEKSLACLRLSVAVATEGDRVVENKISKETEELGGHTI